MSEVTFYTLVVSLATTAAVHFGDMADPATGRRREPDLEGAGQAIEMLALLERKTAGNLTAWESAFVGKLLAELRRRLVEAYARQEGPGRAGEGSRPPASTR